MKNIETTDKKSRVLNAVGGINDEFILEAAPTGRHESRSYRGLIAAAIGTAAAAAVVLIAVFGGKGKPNAPMQQVRESERPVNATEVPETEAPAPGQHPVTRTVSLGKATNAKEWAELAAEASVVDSLEEYLSAQFFTFDDWLPPTPESILLSKDACIFRGVVREVENRRITVASSDNIADTSPSFDYDFCIVTFDVIECYKGSLAAGEQTRVFFDSFICPIAEIEPPIGEKGSGQAYFTQLSPGTEVIAVVKGCGENEELEIRLVDENSDPVLSFSRAYRDYAECRFRGGFGRLFLQTEDKFLYDVDVYDAAMLGENPSLDSAESYIKGLLSGLEL